MTVRGRLHLACRAVMAVSTGMAIFFLPTSYVSAAVSTYRYDALGRLRKVCNAVPGQAYQTDYSLDASDNRSSYSNIRTDISIPVNTGIYSPNNRFVLQMQPDGNLVLYRLNPTVALWSTSTDGSGANFAYFQDDGNFVLYKPDGTSPWHSVTYGNFCSKLEIQNDGNVLIRNFDGKVIWQTFTGGH